MNKISKAKYSLRTQKFYLFPALRNLDNFKVFILLAITIWIAYFWHSASFGLYSDDFRRVGDAMEMTWFELGSVLQELFLMKQGQGRPLHDGLIYLWSFIGFRLGGLHVLYWIGYVILTVNSFLFYTLLKRLSDQQTFAVTGALAFCLFPAYTVQTWLTITLGVQPSLMLLLIAIHCYLSGRKKWSYLFIFGSLFCYETLFPLFIAAPLLKQKWNYKLTRKVIRHGLILAGMLACVALLRKLTGEQRVDNLDLLEAIKTSIQHTYLGSITNLKTFLTRPLTTLKALAVRAPLELWIFFPLCFAGFLYVLSRLKLSLPRDKFLLKTTFDNKVLHLETTELFDHLAKLVLIGIIMLGLAYPLTFLRDPNVVNGQSSRDHLAGSVGASILMGCICSIIFLLTAAYGRKRLATVGLAIFFALLVGFGILIQQDYMLAWQYQRQYWTDAIELIPDLDEQTVIFVDRAGFRHLKYITGGVMPSGTLSKIYHFPDNWEKPTWLNAYTMNQNWQKNIVANGNSFQLNPSVADEGWLGTDKQRNVESSKVILLEIKDGRLTRRTEPLIIDGKEFPLKEKIATGLPSFEKGPLYDYLIKSPDEKPINIYSSL